MKIIIETDGHYKTTAECNGITAESFCNHMDAFKLTKGVHMAVQRLIEKLEKEEDTGFHVGDTVEVLATHTHFLQGSVGLQGKIKRYAKRDDMCLITLPIDFEDFEGVNEWWYHKSELKLISKEDTGFHVGDIVEVVGTHTQFLQESVGLQGKVKRYDKKADMCLVTLPIECGGNSVWWYHKSELKVLSKEDTGFHVGDIVEVVEADGYRFFDKVKGIQGVIVSNHNTGLCEVKFPFIVSKKENWYFHIQALKLIRRVKK